MFYKTKNIYEQYTYSNQEFIDNKRVVFLWRRGSMKYGMNLNDLLGLHFFMASDFNPAQLITYMFMHGGFQHLFFNMFALWMFGRTLEQVWGPKRFLSYYMICGIGAGWCRSWCNMYSM